MNQKLKTKDTSLAIIFIFFLIGFFTEDSRFFVVAGITTLTAMIIEWPFRLLSKYWFGLSNLLSKIVSIIILGVIFYIFLLPISLLYRLTQKNYLLLKNKSNSFFITRNYKYKESDLYKPF